MVYFVVVNYWMFVIFPHYPVHIYTNIKVLNACAFLCILSVLFLLDNEHIYMELGQKLSKYCPKEWKREASKVSCKQSLMFLGEIFCCCCTL